MTRMPPSSRIAIGDRVVAQNASTYFIADIASNHDGSLDRAKELIGLAKRAGADAAKFQHFKAKSIVSDRGFRALPKLSHQKSWDQSIYQVYEAAEFDRSWDRELAKVAQEVGIHYMSSPYDREAIELLREFVPAFKIGSGEITWVEAIENIARCGKPVIIAAGAAEIEDVDRAVDAVLKHTPNCILLQCNTNYTGDDANFDYINLTVLRTFAARYPGLLLGLSDHTPGHATVLGAIALGARVVEKHFTDDNSRRGPDHAFSMTPTTWREMVDRSRELERALGDGVKRIEANERDAVVVQRRCLRLRRDVAVGHVLTAEDLEPLRPAPNGSVEPYALDRVVGVAMRNARVAGDALNWQDVGATNA
jgi:N-acetylneuraminate synthase